MAAIDKFERELKKVLEIKADKPIRYTGFLGVYIDAVETVVVPNRPNFVYVRLNDSEIIQAFNNTVNGTFNLAVIVEKQANLNYYRVVDVQIEKYQTMNNVTFVSKHAQTHLFGENNSGNDPVFVYKRQLLQPFGTAPTSPPSMRVQVFGDYYLWNGQIQKLLDTISNDLTVYLPTGAENGKFVTIYVDGNSNSLGYLAGTEFYNSFYTTGTDFYIPEVSPNIGIQFTSILLMTGTTTAEWANIKDIRNFLNNNTASTATALHPLDPDLGYHSGTLQAKYVTILDSGGYYTGSTVEQALNELVYRIYDSHHNKRWIAPSGTISLLFSEPVYMINNVSVNGIILDTTQYGLTGTLALVFSGTLPYQATVISEYMRL